MKIKSVKISGLSGTIDCDFKFDNEINLITGINGSGKTTLLKILWYAVSGNIERIAPEISFASFDLETTDYSISLENDDNIISWKFLSREVSETGQYDPAADQFHDSGSEIVNRLVVEHSRSSLYFPTFRRIEGGYSMANTRRVRRRLRSGEIVTDMIERDDVQNEFDQISARLSVMEHRFVCSISTHDIVSLLTSRYARASEKLNEHYRKLSTSMIGKIEGAKSGLDDESIDAAEILSEIQEQAAKVNEKRDQLMKPFEVLSSLAAKVFRHKGIRVRTVTLGESVDAIDSGALSAGEKQMLSFLCYNAFYSDSMIFIDEPELSLHPDWQRKLFPTLLKQESNNQFIVATHSPFIYSKYEDKELSMAEDRGE